jgi:SAM-dependent methyltransferase
MLFELNSTQHVDMLNERRARFARLLPVRILRAIKREVAYGGLYGQEWGDPDVWDPLRYNPEATVVEIGPGGGRWTRYLLPCKLIYAVDHYDEVIAEFARSYGKQPNVRIIKNNGTDFPGIPPQSVDLVFTFGCFVHIKQELIGDYLANIKTILKPGGNAVVHYSDKTKVMARDNTGFSDNNPEAMRRLVTGHGFKILGEDTTTMWHSSVIHFTV